MRLGSRDVTALGPLAAIVCGCLLQAVVAGSNPTDIETGAKLEEEAEVRRSPLALASDIAGQLPVSSQARDRIFLEDDARDGDDAQTRASTWRRVRSRGTHFFHRLFRQLAADSSGADVGGDDDPAVSRHLAARSTVGPSQIPNSSRGDEHRFPDYPDVKVDDFQLGREDKSRHSQHLWERQQDSERHLDPEEEVQWRQHPATERESTVKCRHLAAAKRQAVRQEAVADRQRTRSCTRTVFRGGRRAGELLFPHRLAAAIDLDAAHVGVKPDDDQAVDNEDDEGKELDNGGERDPDGRSRGRGKAGLEREEKEAAAYYSYTADDETDSPRTLKSDKGALTSAELLGVRTRCHALRSARGRHLGDDRRKVYPDAPGKTARLRQLGQRARDDKDAAKKSARQSHSKNSGMVQPSWRRGRENLSLFATLTSSSSLDDAGRLEASLLTSPVGGDRNAGNRPAPRSSAPGPSPSATTLQRRRRRNASDLPFVLSRTSGSSSGPAAASGQRQSTTFRNPRAADTASRDPATPPEPTRTSLKASGFGSAVYFTGLEVLLLKRSAHVAPDRDLPRSSFSVEFWVQPEGGQNNPSVIVALSDTCDKSSPVGYWSVGIQAVSHVGSRSGTSKAGHTGARFYFALKTARAADSSKLFAHTRYVPGEWTHLAATYDGQKMALFVNGALVAVRRKQSKEVFPEAAAPCKVLTLGGRVFDGGENGGEGTSEDGVVEEEDEDDEEENPGEGARGNLRQSAAEAKGTGREGAPRSFSSSSSSTTSSPPSFSSFISNAFRGSVDRLRVWHRALNHSEVWDMVRQVAAFALEHSTAGTAAGWQTRPPQSSRPSPFAPDAGNEQSVDHSGQTPRWLASPRQPSGNPRNAEEEADLRDLYLADSFDDLSQWLWEEAGRPARVVESTLKHPSSYLSTPIPRCGYTICDNPAVALSYAQHRQLRPAKQIRYRVVNLMNDDGSRQTVNDLQILKQDDALNRAFRPYNISFRLDIYNVRNTTLRERFIMFGCDPENIGDGICNSECQHTRTGYDGGDCDPIRTECEPRSKGNGRCDFACNKHYHDWDGGDCCLPGPDTHYTCYDPSSPYRSYQSVDQFREIVNLRSDTHMNVFFADWTTNHLIGLATFPWEKSIYSVQGGTVVQPQTFGMDNQMESLVHEIGHNLGLWHVHHGVSEMDCGDPCAETEASMELGDLCADTNPTPQNVQCEEPGVAADSCGVMSSYRGTPFRNYMSYADDNCTDHFTPQQVGRMHCYLDLAYQPWQMTPRPAAVPLPPKIVAATQGSVTIAWLPPIGGAADTRRAVCGLCDPTGVLVQFAFSAFSHAPTSAGTRWSPDQATGPPDAEPCVPSIRAWLPDVQMCTKRTCMLELTLKTPVIADTITLWVTWNAEDVRKIRLMYEGGKSSVLKSAPAFCDVPFTAKLSTKRRLHKVRVYTRTPFTAIDALQVVSRPDESACRGCRPVRFHVYRHPGFAAGRFRHTDDRHLTDTEVKSGVEYQYWVEAAQGSKNSQPSPVLTYREGDRFCGDGSVDSDRDEQCDDGNIQPGDGCDSVCHMESTFYCRGSPSLCYRHDGDGICEDFEKETSVLDCGFYTPKGFSDQWAHDAVANPEHQLPSCPARIATGAPEVTQECGLIVDPKQAWFPCGTLTETGNFWIELYVPRPVVVTAVIVHVAADGRTEADPAPKTLSLELIRDDNSSIVLTPRPVTLDCARHQLHVPVKHDLSTPFYKSRGVRLTFQSYNISIAAVRVRSSQYLDPVTLASCRADEVFNPHSGLCLTRNCTRSTCPPYVIDHGQAHCTGYADGDVCSVTCDEGYTPESKSMEVACRGGQWSSTKSVVCRPIDCGLPLIPLSSVDCPRGTTYGKNCTFRCLPPAHLHGLDNWVVCEKDGLWSTPLAHCLVTCPPPLHVKNVRPPKQRCRVGAQPVGSRCKFRCNHDYHVAGARPNRRVFRISCESDGSWSEGHCEKVACPKLDPIFSGLVTCTEGVAVGSRCTLRCPRSRETQAVICSSSGKWNASFQRCAAFDEVTCPLPVEDTSVVLRCVRLTAGSKCPVTCKTPDDEPIYVTKKTNADVTPKDADTGEAIRMLTCTGVGQWFPPLAQIKCVERCSEKFKGDQWCDARNNRKHCGWDGGDCCESTVGGKVRPFPESCTKACTCRDPHAAENQNRKKKKRRKNG